MPTVRRLRIPPTSAGLGRGGYTAGRGIAVDAAGNAYVTGLAENGFSTTPGAFQPECATAPDLCTDAFVLKLNPSGSAPVWSTYLGGSSGEQGNAITLDSKGHVYVTGSTLSTDFPTRFPVQGTYAGGDNSWHGDYYGGDVFVSKLSADGSRLLYSTYLGGSGADAGLGIAVDQAGNAYVAGLTASTDFPTVNAVQSSKHGSWDVIVFKLASTTDFNADGHPDLLWQHETSGTVVVWYLNGHRVSRWGPSSSRAWTPPGRSWGRPTSTPTATPTSSGSTRRRGWSWFGT